MIQNTLTPAEALRYIQILVAIPLLVFGVYMMTPVYVITPSAAFGTVAATSAIYVKAVGFAMAVSGIGTLYGGVVNNRHKGTKILIWAAVSMYTLLLVTRLLTIGIFPMIWVFTLALMGISAVLALTVRER